MARRGPAGSRRVAGGNPLAATHSSVDFVPLVTWPASTDFNSRADWIGVFDNDGTLQPELLTWVQVGFALQRVKTVVAKHSEWKRQ